LSATSLAENLFIKKKMYYIFIRSIIKLKNLHIFTPVDNKASGDEIP